MLPVIIDPNDAKEDERGANDVIGIEGFMEKDDARKDRDECPQVIEDAYP